MSIEPTATPSDMLTLSRETFWQQHIMQWRSSGLSKMAYCEQFSLVYHQMVYWSKKLEDEPEQQSETGRFVPVRVPHTVSASKSGYLAYQICLYFIFHGRSAS